MTIVAGHERFDEVLAALGIGNGETGLAKQQAADRTKAPRPEPMLFRPDEIPRVLLASDHAPLSSKDERPHRRTWERIFMAKDEARVAFKISWSVSGKICTI